MAKPRKFLRCYGYRTDKGVWYGVCVDLNIAAQGKSMDDLKRKLKESVESYIDVVLDTNDKQSIPALLKRRAPLQDWVYYYCARIGLFVGKFFSFNCQEFRVVYG